MTILDIHPAFGYEWQQRWEVAVKQRDRQLEQKGENPAKASHRLWGAERIKANNLSKVASYVPILNVIVGIAYIILALQSFTANTDKQAIINRYMYRGVATILLGPLLLIADIIQTLRDRNVVLKNA